MSARRRWLSVLLLAGASCASAPPIDHLDLDGWRELRAEWFVLSGDLPQEELERYGEQLALFVAVARRITTMPQEPPARPPHFFLLADDTFRALEVSARGCIVPHLEGHASAVWLQPRRSRPTLFHEYAHFLLRHGKQVALPIWYDEGFATLMSSTREREGLLRVGRSVEIALQAARERPIDLADVFALQQRTDMGDVGAFYAAAWAATHYLNLGSERRVRMQRFLERQAAGEPWEVAYAASFDVPIEALSEQVRDHAAKLAAGIPLLILEADVEAFEVDRRFSIREVDEAEAAARLADLVALDYGADARESTRRLEFALALQAHALERSGGDARYRAAQAETLARLGRGEASMQEVDAALLALPGDAEVLLRVAEAKRALAVQSEDEEARALRREARVFFERAHEADPGRPAAWAGIGWSYVGSGDPPERGIQALREARRLGGWDDDVNLDLAELYLAAGEPERAIERWEDVARMSWHPARVEQARRRIEHLRSRARTSAAGE